MIEGKKKMEKNNRKALNRLLAGFAALGALFTASGCTTTVRASDNFRVPARYSMTQRVQPTIAAQPLDVQIQSTTITAQPVWVMPAGYAYTHHRHYRRGHGGSYRYYRGGRGGTYRHYPTAGQMLGNTMRGVRPTYRHYPTAGQMLGNTNNGHVRPSYSSTPSAGSMLGNTNNGHVRPSYSSTPSAGNMLGNTNNGHVRPSYSSTPSAGSMLGNTHRSGGSTYRSRPTAGQMLKNTYRGRSR